MGSGRLCSARPHEARGGLGLARRTTGQRIRRRRHLPTRPGAGGATQEARRCGVGELGFAGRARTYKGSHDLSFLARMPGKAGGGAVLVSRPGTPWPWRRAQMGFGEPGCRAGADRVGRKGLAGWAEPGWKGERPENFRELEWTCEVFKGTMVDFG
jgi:hypothetical protein